MIIWNPPFGNRGNLYRAFCDKAFDIAEYVSFILPVSQLNNTSSIYKYNLIYSENLGTVQFSDRTVPVCFNMYQIPKAGHNKKSKYQSNYVKIHERNKGMGYDRPVPEYDLLINGWGEIGKVITPGEYTKELYITIKDTLLKSSIIDIIVNAKWIELYPMIAAPNLLHWHIHKYLDSQLTKVI